MQLGSEAQQLTCRAMVSSTKTCSTTRQMTAASTACCPSDVRQNLRHRNSTLMDLLGMQTLTRLGHTDGTA